MMVVDIDQHRIRRGEFSGTVKNTMDMKTLTCIVTLLVTLPSANALAVDDKTAHFGISALFGAGAETVLHYRTDLEDVPRVALATVLGSLPGLGKEIADSREDGNEFSGRDLGADIAGAFSGALLSSLFNNAIQLHVEATDGKRVNILFAKRL
jgi:uncharacterized protein YfiM (DUF2279 family)